MKPTLRLFYCSLVTAILTGVGMEPALPAQTVPALVNYQGRLANPDGTALATGDYTLTFRVYDSATNNNSPVWGPQIFDGVAGQGHGVKIPVVQGYFNVMLGPVDANSVSLENAFNATNRYVEIRVGTNNPILPRQQILSAPFALQAGNSAKLAGADWSTVFGTNDPVYGRIPASKLATNSVSITNLIARQVGTNVGVGGLALSLSSADYSFTSGGNPSIDFPVSNLVVTLATTGTRPVMVQLIADPFVDLYPNASYIGMQNAQSYTIYYVSLYRGTNRVARTTSGVNPANNQSGVNPPSTFSFLDCNPPTGTNTYSISAGDVNNNTVHFYFVRMIAYEL